MARNIELLTKVRDLIKKDPDKLDMGLWGPVADVIDFGDSTGAKVSCGTTACIAGWAVQLHGYQLLVHPDHLGDDGVYEVSYCVGGNKCPMDIEKKAREILGLSQAESDFLFLDIMNSEAVTALDGLIAGESVREVQFTLYGQEED